MALRLIFKYTGLRGWYANVTENKNTVNGYSGPAVVAADRQHSLAVVINDTADANPLNCCNVDTVIFRRPQSNGSNLNLVGESAVPAQEVVL